MTATLRDLLKDAKTKIAISRAVKNLELIDELTEL